ncbi:MAG TPA: immunoglobulin domain-containing protein [Acidimicrobiales bacterium]|nr:immunoglobulin domain-containing protein [Acidimicrobiales bacterium]
MLRSTVAVIGLAGGLLIGAPLLGVETNVGAGTSPTPCASAASLLFAHQDGSVNEETPTSPTCSPAPYYGSMAGTHLTAPVVGIAATPYGGGYWLASADGGVFTFGDANYYGSLGGHHLNAPIVGVTATPDGGGYWLVAADGGVFSFGDAQYWGSTGGIRLNAPIVGMSADATTGGYWLVASDGGVFAFHAPFFGSMAGTRLAASIRFIEGTADSGGYRLVGGDGGVFDFGDAQFFGAALGLKVYGWGAMTSTPDDGGYWLATNYAPGAALNVESFGDAVGYGEHLSAGALTTSPIVAATTYLPFNGSAPPPPPAQGGNGPVPPTGCLPAPGSVPVIVQQPSSEDVPVGGSASFTAVASSTPAATVQWQVSIDEGVSYSNIANAVSPTLTFPVTPSESGGFYRAYFTNTHGSTFTNSVTLTVGNAPDVVVEPTNQVAAPGATATFTASATGTPTPSEQWESSSDGGKTWIGIANATSNTLLIGVTAEQNGNLYRAYFSNSSGAALSSVAELLEPPIVEC